MIDEHKVIAWVVYSCIVLVFGAMFFVGMYNIFENRRLVTSGNVLTAEQPEPLRIPPPLPRPKFWVSDESVLIEGHGGHGARAWIVHSSDHPSQCVLVVERLNPGTYQDIGTIAAIPWACS